MQPRRELTTVITGIGVDLVSVSRIRAAIDRHGGRARRRLFTPRELADCDERLEPAECMAARFAAKEAAFKAVGTGKCAGARWTDVEVVTEAGGRPRLELSGTTAERARELGTSRIHISLTHEAGLACAFVVLEGESPTA